MSELTSLLRHSVIALAEASAPLDGPLIMYQELRYVTAAFKMSLSLVKQSEPILNFVSRMSRRGQISVDCRML